MAPAPRTADAAAERALVLIGQLRRLEVEPPTDAVLRAKLTAGLDELAAWASSLKERLAAGRV